MRIALVAPLHESVPPRLYGGTERVVSYLAEELVAQGHDVTLFASGDSCTAARLISPCPRALRLDRNCVDPLAHHILLLEQVLSRASEFDLIHFHTDLIHLPLARRLHVPHVTTLHGRLDIPDLGPLFREFIDAPLISISDAQRAPFPFMNWRATVHHGLPPGLLSPGRGDGGYLAFLGRISPEKGVEEAIQVARALDRPLRIAAKISAVDAEYYQSIVEPMIDGDLVQFLGEVDEKGKQAFLGQATALLFPIDWPEPFGMVMIEAMACGTPVIARRRGSVPEVLESGVTGFICTDFEEMLQGAMMADALDRAQIRSRFEQRFLADRMARDYARAYGRLIEAGAEAEART